MNNSIIKNKHITFIVVCLVILLQACGTKTEQNHTSTVNTISGQCVADTIIYSVVIKNPNPLDTWTDECLSQLKRSQLVDQFFEAVYEHKAKAYSYSTHEVLSVSDIEEMENTDEFNRDKVAKLQFWETWYFDEQQQAMHKKVHAVLVAYEMQTDDGELRGYKAAFYIKMQQ